MDFDSEINNFVILLHLNTLVNQNFIVKINNKNKAVQRKIDYQKNNFLNLMDGALKIEFVSI